MFADIKLLFFSACYSIFTPSWTLFQKFFFLHLNFIPVFFLLETLHLFLSDTATHLSLYQYNSVECNLLAGDMKQKQHGQVQLNSQILSCICLYLFFFCCCLIGDLSQTTAKLSPVSVLCFVCMCVCLCVWSCGWGESRPMVVEFKLLSEPVGGLQAQLFQPWTDPVWDATPGMSSRKAKLSCDCASTVMCM